MTNTFDGPFLFQGGVLDEPTVIFGGGQEHIDPKIGLSIFGPYCPSDQRTPLLQAINVGIVGPGNMVADAEEWLRLCSEAVTNAGAQPFLAPEFIGINRHNAFQCALNFGDPLRSLVKQEKLEQALAATNFYDRIRLVADLYGDCIETLAQRDPRANVVICAIPRNVIDACTSVRRRSGEIKRRTIPKSERRAMKSAQLGQGFLWSAMNPLTTIEDDVWEFSDLRRAIKVLAMQHDMPTQLAWPHSIALSDPDRLTAQDRATRAWNFVVALYYKAGGTPWRINGIDRDVCLVGLSFYKSLRDPESQLRTAMAQIFTSSGDGYVLRGNTFEWDAKREKSRSPHLDRESAAHLVREIIGLYSRQNEGSLPRRLVIHKSSRYWDGERLGFMETSSQIPQVDLVALQWRGVQFYRTGHYPPLRGTYVKFSDSNQLLYTVGFVPALRSYNGPRAPQPIEIIEHFGDTPWLDILKEILCLTKLNWNTAAFNCSEPITLAFSRRVGEILSELGANKKMKNEYRFYM
jgi:hypothetical protein